VSGEGTPSIGVTRRIDAILAVAIVVAGISTVGLASASASVPGEAPDADRYLSAYRDAQTDRDRLPEKFPADLHGDGGLDASTSRFLGEPDAGVSYWSVADRSGNLCLVVVDIGRGMTGAGCGEVSQLERGQIAFSHFLAEKGGLQAFLVADGFARAEIPAPWRRAGANLIVVAHEDADAAALTLTGARGQTTLTPFPEVR
jgi:hypothetical protein